MWGQITVGKAERGNSGEIPLWRMISSKHPGRGRSLALMIHGGVDVYFFAELGKKEVLESPMVLFWVLSAPTHRRAPTHRPASRQH